MRVQSHRHLSHSKGGVRQVGREEGGMKCGLEGTEDGEAGEALSC